MGNYLLYCLFPLFLLIASPSLAQDVDDSITESTENEITLNARKEKRQARRNNRVKNKELSEESKVFVQFSGVENEAYLANINSYVELVEEDGKVIESASYVNFLARKGVQQVKDALKPFGYYLVDVKRTTSQEDNDWIVHYQVDLGSPLIVRDLNVVLLGEAGQDEDFKALLETELIQKKEILSQPDYEKYKHSFSALATTKGYFDGVFKVAAIRISEDFLFADVDLTYDSGIRYRFGEITILQDFLDQEVLDRYNVIKEGDYYDAKKIADIQRDIYNSDYINQIDVDGAPDKLTKTVPITFHLTRKKRQKYDFALGYGTDTGPRFSFDYTLRWFNQKGHSIGATFFVSQNLIDTGVEYKIPGSRPATDYYSLFANYKVDNTNDRNSTIYSLGGYYHDQHHDLEREIGIKYQREDFTLGFDHGDVAVLAPHLHLIYKKADNLLNTTDGLLLDFYLTGAVENVGSDITFLQAVGKAKYIKRINHKHKFVLKGALGQTFTDDFHQLPPSYRFFTGGDRTVRGYSFEDIGERDGSGDVIGGDQMYLMSAEYEYFFRDDMAVATFLDIGDAYTGSSEVPKIGAGLGFHYYSPIGPIKFDVAHGFEEPGDSVRLHLTIGADL